MRDALKGVPYCPEWWPALCCVHRCFVLEARDGPGALLETVVSCACRQRKFSGDVRLHGLRLLRLGHRNDILSQQHSLRVSDAGADDIWRRLPDATARGDRARRLRRQTWTPGWTHPDVEPHVSRHLVDRMRAGLCLHRDIGAAARARWASPAGIFCRDAAGRCLRLPLGNCAAWSQGVLRELAIGQVSRPRWCSPRSSA